MRRAGRRTSRPALLYPLVPLFHFRVWVTVWVRNFWPTHKVTFCNKKSPKTEVFGDFWSCYPDSNWGPHPYQLIGRIGFAAFRPFCTLFAPGCHPFRNSCVHCLRPLVSPCGSACGSKAAASQPLLLRRNRTVTSLPHPTGSGRGSEPLRSHRTVFCGRLRRR